MKRTKWLFSTIGKRGYIADYLRDADPLAHITGSGSTKFTPGFTSCNETALMPDIASPEYLDAVRRVVREREINAILSFTDPDVAALSTIREELTAAGVRCFFPGRDVATMGFDKLETAKWTAQHGVTAPRTAADPQVALERIGLPLIRKPRFGSASVGVSVIRHANDLFPACHDERDYIYQDFIEGEEVNIELCGDLEGRPIGVSAWKKLLSRNGETELAVTVRRDDLIAHGLRLGELAQVIGPCDVDVIDRGGELFLIEFNMRFGGGYPVSHLAGAGFLELLVRVERGEHPPLDTGFAGDIFMMKTLRPFGGPMSAAEGIFLTRHQYRH
ncbi:MAG: ATP-grasp domain-containing protein [Bryobacteraceae bacterium]|nr:ATP-grasp domain-containing protein [Bryobacteraceae bacterium]